MSQGEIVERVVRYVVTEIVDRPEEIELTHGRGRPRRSGRRSPDREIGHGASDRSSRAGWLARFARWLRRPPTRKVCTPGSSSSTRCLVGPANHCLVG